MLRRLFGWLKSQRDWTRSHSAAWAGQIEPREDGWSAFQRQCESAVVATLERVGHALVDRVEHVGKERYIEARLSGSPHRIWIYVDGADLTGPGIETRLEHWDARTPSELTGRFCAAIEEALRDPAASAV